MSEKIFVLVVDDEARFALNLVKILNRRGFSADAAFDGFQALEKLKSGAARDIVILDVKMPIMDGIETLAEIKEIAPDTEVIMLTGHATIDSGIQAMRMGAYDYLMKPCDPEDLIEKIKEAHQRERIKHQPVLWPRNTVGDCTLISFRKLLPDDPLENAVAVFHRKVSEETGSVVVQGLIVAPTLGQLEIGRPSGSTSTNTRRPSIVTNSCVGGTSTVPNTWLQINTASSVNSFISPSQSQCAHREW